MAEKTVIICDDDEGILDVASIVLEEKGYTVLPLGNCDEVQDLVHKEKPDLILMDLWMPGKGGEQVTKELKSDPDTASIPIIIVSASKNTKDTALSAGADDFLYKPFDIEELETMVDKYIK